MCAKNYENWMTVDKVIAKIIWPRFLDHPVDDINVTHCTSAQANPPVQPSIGQFYQVACCVAFRQMWNTPSQACRNLVPREIGANLIQIGRDLSEFSSQANSRARFNEHRVFILTTYIVIRRDRV